MEVVEGSFNPSNGVLVLQGVALEEPPGHRILGLANYMLMVSTDGAALSGFYSLLPSGRDRPRLGAAHFDIHRDFGVFRADRASS